MGKNSVLLLLVLWLCFVGQYVMAFPSGGSDVSGYDTSISTIDSLSARLKEARNDTERLELLKGIGENYEFVNYDSALHYYEKSYVLAKQLKDGIQLGEILNLQGLLYKSRSEYIVSIEKHEEAIEILNGLPGLDNEGVFSLARNYSNMGESYRHLSRYDEALQMYDKSIEVLNSADTTIISGDYSFEEISAGCYNNIGLVNLFQGDYSDAITNYQKSLAIFQTINKPQSIANAYTNIGSVHFYQQNYDKAVEYYSEALKTFESIGDKKGELACISNIGSVHVYIGKRTEQIDQKIARFFSGIEYFERAVKLCREIEDRNNTADCLGNIGLTYSEIAFFSNGSKEYYKKAIEYYYESLKIKEEIGDELGLSIVYNNISSLNNKRGSYKEAIESADKSLEISSRIGAKKQKKAAYDNLSKGYEGLGDIKRAFEYFKQATYINDSLFNEKKSEQIEEMEERFQSEKKQLEIEKLTSEKALQKAEIKAKDEENKKQRILIISFVIGFVIILLCAVLLVLLFVQKKRANRILFAQNEEIKQKNEEIASQRDEIEAQRDLVTEQRDYISEMHIEITDSIQYARRIQNAVMLTSGNAGEILGEHFILFRPKDVVSGDFYWATQVNEWLVVTVADCTGHGVPGAFMSMLGVSFLNEIVRKKEVANAAIVLNELRKSVIDALQQTGEAGTQKDGMDMSLIAIHKDRKRALWAGANNPLYLIRKVIGSPSDESNGKQSVTSEKINSVTSGSDNDMELIEYRPDKMPVAVHLCMDSFTNHEIELYKGDQFYLFTDGFPDQFGGPSGKKFMYKPFKKLLLEATGLPMSEQKDLLDKTLDDWMLSHSETYEQIDDISVLSIRI